MPSGRLIKTKSKKQSPESAKKRTDAAKLKREQNKTKGSSSDGKRKKTIVQKPQNDLSLLEVLKRSSMPSKDLVAFGNTKRYLVDTEIESILDTLIEEDKIHNITKLPVLPLLQLIDQIKDRDVLKRLKNTNSGETIISIVNTVDKKGVGLHWFLIIFDTKHQKMFIVDSMKRTDKTKADQQKFTQEIVSLLPEYTIRADGINVQTDGYNCGVWCLEMVRQYIISGLDDDALSTKNLNHIDINESRRDFSEILYPTKPFVHEEEGEEEEEEGEEEEDEGEEEEEGEEEDMGEREREEREDEEEEESKYQ